MIPDDQNLFESQEIAPGVPEFEEFGGLEFPEIFNRHRGVFEQGGAFQNMAVQLVMLFRKC